MKIPNVTIQQLLEAGVHLGHKTLRWNPKMKKYIFGKRDSIHIIDLTQTLELIKIASLKDLFNSPINEISFNVKSIEQIQEISKFLNQDGKTQVKFNLSTEDQILNFQLKKPMNLDRKSLNLLRKQQIQAEIS